MATSPNDILNAGILEATPTARDSWRWGTVQENPVGNVAQVIIDGDSNPTSMIMLCDCDHGHRVLVLLLGQSFVVVGNVNWQDFLS